MRGPETWLRHMTSAALVISAFSSLRGTDFAPWL
jgi:hypothetical protein